MAEKALGQQEIGKILSGKGAIEIKEKSKQLQPEQKISQEPAVNQLPDAAGKLQENTTAISSQIPSFRNKKLNATPEGELLASNVPGGQQDIDIQVQADTVEKELSAAELLQSNRDRSGRRVIKISGDGEETGTIHLQGQAQQKRIIFNDVDISSKNHSSPHHHGTLSDVGEDVSFAGVSKENGETHFLIREAAGLNGKEKIVLHSDDAQLQNMLTHETPTTENLAKAGRASLNSQEYRNFINDDSIIDQIQTGLPSRLKTSQSVTIKLWPENLGKVDIKLTLRGQQLAATFMVEQSEVKDAMLRKIDSLRDGLQVRGIDVKGIEIKVIHARAGDGPNVGVGDQQLNNFTWQQNSHNAFAHSFSGSPQTFGNENGEILDESVGSAINPVNSGEISMTSGSFHIMA
jgi:flagellar hook-length control protein FliK